MQDFKPCSSLSGSGSLTDRRDNQVYTVAKINGNWWMTRNLAIGCNGSGSSYGSSMSSKQLTSTYSNISTNWSTPTANLSSGDSYTDPRMACSSTYGAWYNYAATTAGTIIGDSNTTDAAYDICPARWRLPNSTEFSSIFSQITIFNPAAGGAYGNGSHYALDYGDWWSSSYYDSGNQHILNYDSIGKIPKIKQYPRAMGFQIRCILK